MPIFLRYGLLSLLLIGATSRTYAQIQLELVVENLTQPISLKNAGDGSGRLYVVEQGGRVKVIENGSVVSGNFLNISSQISTGGERGLLDIAFHPNYSQNGRLFTHYTDTGQDTVISEWQVNLQTGQVDTGSERIIITANQPYGNHNGGQIAFSPTDGYLYIALGDGGSGGDPDENGQDLSTLLGSILRLDVDGSTPYEIPADNPFVGVSGAKAEIWAYGLRNPWRFSFDRLDGRLFAGDVGQGAREEVDLITRGGDYGWNTMEGNLCFDPSSNCDRTGLILPIHDYGRSLGVSVIGGYVYRGADIGGLYGKYVFTDFIGQQIWTLEETSPGNWQRADLLPKNFSVSSLGEDESGELYLVDIGGAVYKIIPTGRSLRPPTNLSFQ